MLLLRKIHNKYKRNEYQLWVTFLIFLALGFIGCCFALYGRNETTPPSPPSSFEGLRYWWLFMEIFPVTVFLIALGSLPKKLKILRNDINKRWEKIEPFHQDDSDHKRFQNIKRYFRCIFKLEFGITLLSTPKNILMLFLGHMVFIIWSFGWILYTLAIWSDTHAAHSITGTLLYAATSSLDLFFFNINGNIIDNIDLSNFATAILTGLISLSAVLASATLGSLILGMFLTKIVNNLKAKRIVITSENNNHLYIFFDQNETSVILSQSIQRNDPKALVIMIHENFIKEEDEDGWKNILNIFTAKNKMNYEYDVDQHLIHMQTSINIEDAVNQQNNDCSTSVWEYLGLDILNRYIDEMGDVSKTINDNDNKDKCQCEINLFYLSKDRDLNVLHTKLMAEALKKDLRLNNVAKSIFCVTRQDSVTSIIEDRHVSADSHLKIKILDDSRLSIKELIRNYLYHPIQFVEIDTKDNPGSVKSKFNSLIIGFGETGRDAFRFLYEFGAFLDYEPFVEDNKDISARSPFECHIIDPEIEKVKAPFIANSPSIFKKPIMGDKNNIKFYKFDHTTTDFYNLLDLISKDLNYVVIATGDDETNITIALRVLEYVRKKRETDILTNFKIFVRTYEKNSISHIENIVNYTKELFKEDDHVNDYIVLFGKKENIYSYDLVIDDPETKEASMYHNKYEELANNIKHKDNEDTEWIILCKKLDYEYYKANTKLHKQEKHPEALFNVKRMIDESRKNSMHSATKLHILTYVMGENSGNAKEEDIINRIDCNLKDIKGELKDRFEFIQHHALSKNATIDQKLIYNLCKLEHIRWNASNQLRGFVYGKRKNNISKTHDCLTVWENLDEGSKRYDYPVVETSIYLKTKK